MPTYRKKDRGEELTKIVGRTGQLGRIAQPPALALVIDQKKKKKQKKKTQPIE